MKLSNFIVINRQNVLKGGGEMNKQLIDSIKPRNIYALYFKNGESIILEITHVNSGNGSIKGYDCFGRPTVLGIHSICGFGKLASFPMLSSKAEQNGKIQDVNARNKSNKSFGEIPLGSVRIIEPDRLLDIKGEKTEDVDLIQEQKNPLGSIEYSIINNRQPNDNLRNNKKHDSIIVQEKNTLLSIKIISINGNSIIEKSGGASVD